MSRIMPRLGGMAVLCGVMLVTSAPTVRADGPTAEQLLAEIDALKLPTFDMSKREDRAAVQKYMTEQQEVSAKRAEKIQALYKVDPGNARLSKLMPEVWRTKIFKPDAAKALRPELDEIIASKSNPELVKEAGYLRVILAMRESGDEPNVDVALKAVDEYQALVGKDERVASLLYQLASATDDVDRKKQLFGRITEDFPGSPAVKRIEGARRQVDGVGKPFDLEFTDAIKGSPVSIKGLKGKVVVIDFWATWCGPCVAEMPTMKKLYAEYKDQGVEFIGVSLDQPKEQGGLDKLKEFVEKNDIQWPQYYQGNYWNSEFSMGWGVNAIPCVFLVDADGKLASVNARGKLEKMIPEYLQKAHADLK